MTPEIDAQFVTRISSLEDHLLDPIIDPSSLPEFNRQWASFAGDLQEALLDDTLSISTISLSHALADRMSSVIQAFNDLETISSSIVAALPTTDLDTIPSPPPSPLLNNTSTPYLESAYTWFLTNLHNPYPSIAVRNQIAKETRSARKDIDCWFIEARKRTGWNTLRKTHFSNKRADIVDAARCFFKDASSGRPISSQITFEFAAIAARAKDLYSDKFFESGLLTRFDTALKEMRSETKAATERELVKEKVQKEKVQTNSVPPYPSPDSSPVRSHLSSLSVGEDDLENTDPQLISNTSQKRPASSTSPLDRDHDDSSRPTKRSRTGSPCEDHGPDVTGLPSPALSILTIDDNLTTQPAVLPITSNVCERKRHRSDTDDKDVSIRPHGLFTAAGPQAVSDPLPPFNTSQLDDWFHTHFSPNNLSFETDLFTPLEMELYDFSALHQDDQVLNMVQYPSPEIQGFDVHLPAPDPLDATSFALDIPHDNLNYYELFSLEDHSQGIGRQDITTTGLDFLHELPILSVVSSPNFYGEAPAYPPQTTDDVSADNTPSPGSSSTANTMSTSFIFPPIQALPLENLQNPPKIPSHNIGSSNPMNTNTNLLNGAQSTGALPDRQFPGSEERAAKQRKLLEIQETARRLEAELAIS